MASESSPKAGSKTSRGNGASLVLALADSRKDDLDDGRSGVVGREVRDRELERMRPSWPSPGIVIVNIASFLVSNPSGGDLPSEYELAIEDEVW